MKSRRFQLTPEAQQDIREAWRLVRRRDGKERADALKNRILGFIVSLNELAEIGTRHEEFRPGFRSSGVPGLRTVSVFFVVSSDMVTVVGVSYLDRNVLDRLEERESYEAWFNREANRAIAKADAGGPFVPHDEVMARSKSRIKADRKG
ncbi:plasmid stabilization system [Rhodomicrobium vannielii ATCC 17100]|uniref:Plasmid stabilization system n=1 Tax=Rhodomicrobium vannielii (strain ATCC 17100 / DSM 162 / LMG 4299 / NCIMB 10020 / ATH 3.1.1) TaxID=648757 RepID=E3I6P4_RHOVT|nr:type II toxin-antitoxin system RelE/ParE family toxin [Rhodomicrobium vannielii]ADP70691.1 plasmid stabilization system [Rhodomicrobium vannielii ATCC 17100]